MTIHTDPNRPADPIAVAQAISRVVDEAQEDQGLFLEDGVNREGTTLCVSEVWPELRHLLGGNVEFTVTTSDGQVFTVRVSADGERS